MEAFSIWDLVTKTGLIVKFVLGFLLCASAYSWAVIFTKWVEFKIATRQSEKFLTLFWASKSMEAVLAESKDYDGSPIAHVFKSGYAEYQKLQGKMGEPKVHGDQHWLQASVENIQRALKKSMMQETLKLEKRLSGLATVASVTPFIGLFGTVWGIMNSFMGLSSGGAATLQRVAPGIAEALIATAVGLAAAIPAVIFYNRYLGNLRNLRVEMDSFAGDFTNILKRSFFS